MIRENIGQRDSHVTATTCVNRAIRRVGFHAYFDPRQMTTRCSRNEKSEYDILENPLFCNCNQTLDFALENRRELSDSTRATHCMRTHSAVTVLTKNTNDFDS